MNVEEKTMDQFLDLNLDVIWYPDIKLINAVKDDFGLEIFAILTALKLGELKLSEVEYNGISIDEFVSSDPEEFQDFSIEGLVDLYYNLYQIYDFTENEKLSKKYLNLAHKELMKISKKLRRSDRKNFLEKNLMNQDIISLWKQINN